MSTATHTLLFVTSGQVAAARVRGGRVVQMTSAPRAFDDDLPASIESAGRLVSGRLGKVWLITTEIWQQPLSVPAEVGLRVQAAQLPRFLSFEAEPLSGMGPQEVVPAAVALEADGANRNYWYMHLPAGQFDAVELRVAALGGKLLGALHPAMLPRAVSPNLPRGASWQRIEVWTDLVACLHGEPGRAPRVHLIPTSDGAQDWGTAAETWLAQQGGATHREHLVAESYLTGGFPADAAVPDVFVPLDDEHARSDWLVAWSRALGAYREKTAQFPVIRPRKRPLDAKTRRLLTVGLTAVAVLLCVGHRHLTEHLNSSELQTLREELVTLQAPAKEMARLTKEVREIETSRNQLSEQVDGLAARLEASRTVIDHFRGRMATLVDSLARHAGGEVVIHRIDHDGQGLLIVGRALEQRQASQLGERLASELAPLGLHVAVPKITATYSLPNGAPFNFEVRVLNTTSRRDAPPTLETAPSLREVRAP